MRVSRISALNDSCNQRMHHTGKWFARPRPGCVHQIEDDSSAIYDDGLIADESILDILK